MTWGSEARDVSKKAANSGLFVKLEGKGDSCNVVFLSEPLTYTDDYEGNVTEKVMFEVWDVDVSKRRVLDVNAKHVYKGGWWAILDEGDPDHDGSYQFKVTRTDVGPKTAYSLQPRPRGEVGPGLKGSIKGTTKIDLHEIRNKKHVGGTVGGGSAYDEEREEPPPPDEVPFYPPPHPARVADAVRGLETTA